MREIGMWKWPSEHARFGPLRTMLLSQRVLCQRSGPGSAGGRLHQSDVRIAGACLHWQAWVFGIGRIARRPFAEIEGRTAIRDDPAHEATTRTQPYWVLLQRSFVVLIQSLILTRTRALWHAGNGGAGRGQHPDVQGCCRRG